MATFSVPLTDVDVDAWFPPEEPISEALIKGASATYTVSIFGTSVGYYLEIHGGERVNPLRLGQPVTGRGRDQEGKWVSTGRMTTEATGDAPQFKGPVPGS